MRRAAGREDKGNAWMRGSTKREDERGRGGRG